MILISKQNHMRKQENPAAMSETTLFLPDSSPVEGLNMRGAKFDEAIRNSSPPELPRPANSCKNKVYGCEIIRLISAYQSSARLRNAAHRQVGPKHLHPRLCLHEQIEWSLRPDPDCCSAIALSPEGRRW